jgi:hypothetical protein
MHLQEPEFFLIHKLRVSPETRLVKVLAPTSLFYKEATCKSISMIGLLYAPENPEERKKGMLRVIGPDYHAHIHGTSEPLGTTVTQRYDVPRD